MPTKEAPVTVASVAESPSEDIFDVLENLGTVQHTRVSHTIRPRRHADGICSSKTVGNGNLHEKKKVEQTVIYHFDLFNVMKSEIASSEYLIEMSRLKN